MDSAPETIATAETPRGPLELRERTGTDDTLVHELAVSGSVVADTLTTDTHTALAEDALGLVEPPTRVLLAGLGLGFTAWQVLKDSRVRELHVVEVEDLVHWARLGLTPTLGVLARHPRAHLHEGDVRQVLADEPGGPWDLVLVDAGPWLPVDPDSLVQQALPHLTKGGAVAVSAADGLRVTRP